MASVANWPWNVLGVGPDSDARSIKRAYAAQLKLHRPEQDAAGFQHLHEAYSHALRLVQGAAVAPAVSSPAPRPPAAPDMVSQAPAEHPETSAQAAWVIFLINAGAYPEASLAALRNDPHLITLAAREAFEVQALHYCAGADCQDALREAMFQYFEWDHNSTSMLGLAPDSLGAARGRRQAYRAFLQLRDRPELADTLALLTAPARNNHAAARLRDARFARHMRGLTRLIRERYPALLHYRLNEELFEWWSRTAEQPRYFYQTALHSALAGGALYLFVYLPLAPAALLGGNWWHTGPFALCQLIAFMGGERLAHKPPERLYRRLASFKASRLDGILHHDRHRRGLQYGWLLPFYALSLCVWTVPAGTALASALGVTFMATAGWALFAASIDFTRFRCVLVVLLTTAACVYLWHMGENGYGLPAYLGMSVGLSVLIVRGGASAYAAFGLPVSYLLPLRLVWLAGTILLWSGLSGTAPERWMVALGWTWSLAGLLLMSMRSWNTHGWFQISGVLFACCGPLMISLLGTASTGLLLSLLLISSFFMLSNMYYAKIAQRPFS